MNGHLEVGDKIPSFTLRDQEGMDVDSNDLIGSPFVIYFYPKDDTPGCTKEACSFRDNMASLDNLDTLVVGISPDSPKSHAKFTEKYELNFPLLSDENLSLASKFGAVQQKSEGTKLSILRTTFLVDAEGYIAWMEKPVSVEGHVSRVIEAINRLVKQ